MTEIKIVKTDAEFAEAKEVILEYVAWLGFDLSFQNFDKEINDLKAMYDLPAGGLLLAKLNGQVAGVAGIRKYTATECELKRMFIREQFRNIGLGKALMLASVKLANDLNYETIKLDTADYMHDAIKLYQSVGFVEIAAYRPNPLRSARFFELQIRPV